MKCLAESRKWLLANWDRSVVSVPQACLRTSRRSFPSVGAPATSSWSLVRCNSLTRLPVCPSSSSNARTVLRPGSRSRISHTRARTLYASSRAISSRRFLRENNSASSEITAAVAAAQLLALIASNIAWRSIPAQRHRSAVSRSGADLRADVDCDRFRPLCSTACLRCQQGQWRIGPVPPPTMLTSWSSFVPILTASADLLCHDRIEQLALIIHADRSLA